MEALIPILMLLLGLALFGGIFKTIDYFDDLIKP
jgi:hypothetical protein